MHKFVFSAFGLLLTLSLAAQMEAPQNWWNLDRGNDNYPGVSSERTHAFLQGKTGQKVIVAVIDSGIDIEHEDLEDIIWTNEDEVAGNNRDDDGNGYIDDVHGWNFIGGAGGTHINNENLEITRIYTRLSNKYANRNPEGLPRAEHEEYNLMMELKRTIDEERAGAEPYYEQYTGMMDALKAIVATTGKDAAEVTADDIRAIEAKDETMGRVQQIAIGYLAEGNTVDGLIGELEGGIDYFGATVNYHYNPEFDARDIVGDNPSNLNDRNYGNNSVEGPDASHGTHVAGIIAAVRGNDMGVDGVAGANIEIMVVRAVPNGDERDKDVANAIRYAVDNGASVINMSFGKSHSPYKGAVDDALKYADKNDVLIVHAAGNDGKELSLTNNYPNDTYLRPGFLRPKSSRTYLTVGASSSEYDANFPASFSNYNTEMVDVFAPGHRIYSTWPGDEYNAISGTSMAAPMVAGIAGLLRSYFPDLTARQVREIIMESAVPVDLQVTLPGTENESVPFSRLSATGGMANAYTAVMLAQQTKGKKKRTADRDPALVGY